MAKIAPEMALFNGDSGAFQCQCAFKTRRSLQMSPVSLLAPVAIVAISTICVIVATGIIGALVATFACCHLSLLTPFAIENGAFY